MYGKEPKSDYTEVNGTSPQEDPYVAYTCPIGMRIKSMETLPEDTFELHDRGDHREDS